MIILSHRPSIPRPLPAPAPPPLSCYSRVNLISEACNKSLSAWSMILDISCSRPQTSSCRTVEVSSRRLPALSFPSLSLCPFGGPRILRGYGDHGVARDCEANIDRQYHYHHCPADFLKSSLYVLAIFRYCKVLSWLCKIENLISTI